jgi:SAM-dependent methyltransferase
MHRNVGELIWAAARRSLPEAARGWVRARIRRQSEGFAFGWVRLGHLRRVTPLSREYGTEPIDRYYLENFLERHSSDIRGRVLEVGDDYHTQRFGGERVSRSDVLDIRRGGAKTSLVGDLARGDFLRSEVFDCVILVQTLQLIYDLRAAIATAHRILKPGGVVLATTSGISQISDPEWADSWYWHLTARSARRLFEECFAPADVATETHGNVLAAIALLHGMSVSELRREELDYHDPEYEVTIAVRAVRGASTTGIVAGRGF